jgi:hypothetical protein
MLAKLSLSLAFISLAASSGTSASRFEAISIKPCTQKIPGGRVPRGYGLVNAGPGRLSAECVTLQTLLRTAYVLYPNGHREDNLPISELRQSLPVPDPIASERFTIEARAKTAESADVMRGPMLQALLEERFGLKVHRETKEIPVFELRLSKGGPKFRAAHGEVHRRSMGLLARQLSDALGREVVDETGLAGEFTFSLQGNFVDPGPGGDAPGHTLTSTRVRMVESAIPGLGLKLEPAKASRTFLVVDHVETPAEN